jgi:hypothetical protein
METLLQGSETEIAFSDDRRQGAPALDPHQPLAQLNCLWLHKVIAEVRMARTLSRVTRNHQMPGRCSGCGLRQQCDQSLAKSC